MSNNFDLSYDGLAESDGLLASDVHDDIVDPVHGVVKNTIFLLSPFEQWHIQISQRYHASSFPCGCVKHTLYNLADSQEADF